MLVRLLFAVLQASPSIYAGDWVGQLELGNSSTFIQARFELPAKGVLDLPLNNRWNVPLADFRTGGSAISFAIPLPSDTARFQGMVTDSVISGSVSSRDGAGRLHLIRRIPYDSSLVRPLAGNYRISSGRVISMGPLDEANGWLSFFDSQTRRGGILYAMSDSVFFTGPSFGVHFPIAIRATVRRSTSGEIKGIRWEEMGRPPVEAQRLADIRQEDVVFDNGPVRLAGNLTFPRVAGKHPAVILIHGAGGTIPTRDFGYWSSFFAGHGIAVLAFDKRGGGASTGNPNTATYEDLADDVLAGMAMLRKRDDIDARCIGFYGMSNGGYIAPLAAERSSAPVAFIAVRAGSAQQVGRNISYEVGNDLRSEGFTESDVEKGVAIRQRVTDFVVSRQRISPESWDSLKKEVEAVSRERWFPWSRVLWVPRINPGDPAAIAFLDKLRSEWKYDPIPHWKNVRAPVYVMLGDVDRSVPSAKSAAMIRDALSTKGRNDAMVRVFNNANHGLLAAQTGYDRETKMLSHYVPGFQNELVSWIAQHVPCKARVRKPL